MSDPNYPERIYLTPSIHGGTSKIWWPPDAGLVPMSELDQEYIRADLHGAEIVRLNALLDEVEAWVSDHRRPYFDSRIYASDNAMLEMDFILAKRKGETDGTDT